MGRMEVRGDLYRIAGARVDTEEQPRQPVHAGDGSGARRNDNWRGGTCNGYGSAIIQ